MRTRIMCALAGLVTAVFLFWQAPSWAAVTIETQIGPLQGNFDQTTTSDTYGDLGEDYKVIFKWDSTKYSSPTVYFEAVLKSNNSSGTAYAKLQVHGLSDEVANSEVSVAGTSYTRVRSSAITLTDNYDYKVIIKTSTGDTASLRACRLVIVQNPSSLSATESHVLLSPYFSTISSSYVQPTYDQRFYYNSSDWDGTVTVLLEATLRNVTSLKTATAALFEYTGPSGGSGVEVTNSSVSNNSISMARGTSSAVTLTSGKWYGVQLKRVGGGTARISQAKLIFQQSGTITKTQSHVPLIYDGTQATGSSYSDFNFPVYFDPANWSGLSNTYFHQVHSKQYDASDPANVLYTELYNSTGTTSLDERRFAQGSPATWTALGPSSPIVMPTTASTLTTRLKHPGSVSGYTANRLIIQTTFGQPAKISKEVHLQSSEAMSASGASWSEAQVITAVPFLWQASNYTNARVYFEAVLYTDDTSNYASAALFKVGSGTPVTESQLFSRSGSYERLRSGNLASLEDGQAYFVQIKNSGGSATTYINTCRLVIYQESASIDKTETHVLLNGFDGSTIFTTTYTAAEMPIYYYYDSSKFDGTVTVYFEAYLIASSGETAYAQLYQVGGSAVSGSEVSTSADVTPERVRSGSITLTSGNQYGIKMKTGAGGGMILEGAKLIIQQSGTGLTKTESYFQFVHNDNATAGFGDNSYTAQNLFNQYEPQNWSGNAPTVYHEATFKVSNASKTGYVELYYGSTELGEQTTTSTSWTRSRSASLTMPTSSTTMEMREMVSSKGTLDVSGNRLIVQSTFTPTVVLLSSFTARGHGEEVLLEWQTGYEARNLGFNVYREESGRRVKLNEGLIKGSALLTGLETVTAGHSYSWLDELAKGALTLQDRQQSCLEDRPPKAALRTGPTGLEDRGKCTNASSASSEAILKSRGLRDAPQGPPGRSLSEAALYWLEDIDLNGKKTLHGPVSVVYSDEPLPKKSPSALLSHLAQREQGQDSRLKRAQSLQARLANDRSKVQGSRSKDPSLSFNPQSAVGGQSFTPNSELRTPNSSIHFNISHRTMDDGKAGVLAGQTPSLLSDKPLKHPLLVQRALAGSSAVKIYIQEEGWYRITRSELVAAGLDPKAKPRFLQLYAQGEEQPLFFPGKKDEVFGPHDAVEFYATGLDTPYTETKVYWLATGTKAGKRIPTAEGHKGRNGISADSFPRTVEAKPRSIYFPALNNGEAENFFGPMVWTTPVEQTLNVFSPSPSPPGEATLEVSLQGVTTGTHKVKVFLNTQEVETISFEGQGQGTMKIPLFQSVLKEGENKISLMAVGEGADISLLDSIRVTYWSTYTAQEDQLKCTAPGGSQVVIDGFTASRVRVVDITDPKAVQELSGVVRSQRAGYAIRVPVPEQGPRTLLAFSEDRVEKPAALQLNDPSSWHQARNGADLVILSHSLFLENLKPLKALREAQGYSVALIDIEDLYNEFSYGNKTPQAIRDFLIQAASYWRKPPRFVLLAGDASYDPRNYLGLGDFDLLPTKTVETTFLEAPSDNWFADITGDGIPDLAIGRLPVRTPEEANTVISKILAYDQTSGPLKDVLLVADMADKDFDFEKAASQVASLFPSNLTVWGLSRAGFNSDAEVHTELLRHLNEGRLWVNYIGHGSMDFWRANIFTSKDAQALTNIKRLSLFVNMTCLNGSFYSPNSDSLAEVLLKSDKGGAVAVWTSSGLTDPNQQLVMNKAFVRALFNGNSPTLGEATVRAKAALGANDVTRTWILFGDPTTRLKY